MLQCAFLTIGQSFADVGTKSSLISDHESDTGKWCDGTLLEHRLPTHKVWHISVQPFRCQSYLLWDKINFMYSERHRNLAQRIWRSLILLRDSLIRSNLQSTVPKNLGGSTNFWTHTIWVSFFFAGEAKPPDLPLPKTIVVERDCKIWLPEN